MADDSIEIPILYDIKNALKALGDLEAKTSESTSKMGASFEALGGLAKLAVAAFASAKVIEFLKKSVDEAQEAQEAFTGLSFAMKATGEFSAEAAKDMQEFATQVQRTTRYSDDAAVQALELAKNFGLTNEQAQLLVKAATNLAHVNRVDLVTATGQLIDTLNGNIKSVKRLGSDVTDLTDSQKAQGAVVNLLNTKYKDIAKTFAGDFGGAVAQATNNFNDIYETFGKIIITNEDFINAILASSKLFVKMSETIEDNASVISSVISGTVKAFDVLYRAGIFVRDIFVVIGSAMYEAAVAGTYLARSVLDIMTLNFTDLKDSIGEVVQASKNHSARVRELTFGITDLFDATEKETQASAKSTKQSDEKSNSFKRQAQSAKDLQKAIEDARKLEEQITKDSLNDIGKVLFERNALYEQIKKFEDQGVIAHQKAQVLREQVDISYYKKLEELSKKAIEEERKRIEEAFKDPVTALIKFDQQDTASFAAIGASMGSALLDGAKGAQKLISAAVGAGAAAAFGPAFGPIAAEITDKLATLGPEGAKAMVREFVDKMPQIIEAIADAIPAVAEALVDSLITRGGIVRIAIALAKAFSGQSVLGAAGKQIGTEASKEMVNGIKNSVGIVAQNISVGIRNGLAGIDTDIANAINSSLAGIGVQISGNIFSALKGGGDYLSVVTSQGISRGAADLSNQIRTSIGDSVNYMNTIVRNAIGDSANYLRDQLYRPINDLRNFLSNFKFPEIKIPGVGGGGGGTGPITGIKGSPIATGGVIPNGFPNDSYPARLTTNERVLNPIQNDRYERILDQISTGNFGGGQGGPMTVILRIGEAELAKVMLNLNRQGYRTA